MYKIFFEDGAVFMGGEPINSLWNKIPDKPIKKIEYVLFGHTIFIEGYDKYNHLLKHNYSILSSKQFVSNIILLAKNGNQVIKFVFDIIKKRLIIEESIFGKEFEGQPSTGWKEGLYDTPKYKII